MLHFNGLLRYCPCIFVGYITMLSVSKPHSVDDRMVDELESIWKQVVVAYSGYCPGICLEGLRKITENLSQFTQHSIQDSNPSPLEYKSAELPLYHPDWLLPCDVTECLILGQALT
jgi:hypothetical protein